MDSVEVQPTRAARAGRGGEDVEATSAGDGDWCQPQAATGEHAGVEGVEVIGLDVEGIERLAGYDTDVASLVSKPALKLALVRRGVALPAPVHRALAARYERETPPASRRVGEGPISELAGGHG